MPHVVYTVQAADEAAGLPGIAQKLLGDEAAWFPIYAANRSVIGNNPTIVHAGQHLIIPEDGLAGAGGAVQVYTVQVADMAAGLEGIAGRLWGQPERWRELYAVNRGGIGDDPRALQPGQRLIIPREAGSGTPSRTSRGTRGEMPTSTS